MNDDARDYVKRVISENADGNGHVPQETLVRLILGLAGEIDSIKDDLNWHGVTQEKHQ